MTPAPIPPFADAVVDAVASVLGRTEGGLTGDEIRRALAAAKIPDPIEAAQQQAPTHHCVRSSKRERIRTAIIEHQTSAGTGKALVGFLHAAMAIVSHIDNPDRFRRWQLELDEKLVTVGLRISDEGRVVRRRKTARTLDEVRALAGRVQRKLKDLDCHHEAVRYCEIELLRQSNFHAASEAVKGIFERLRNLSGSGQDGASLVDEVLSFRNREPVIAISPLETDSECSEQTGLMNLLKGIYGLYRNPLAHESRLAREQTRAISEAELVSVLVTVSLAHQHLDRCKVSASDADASPPSG